MWEWYRTGDFWNVECWVLFQLSISIVQPPEGLASADLCRNAVEQYVGMSLDKDILRCLLHDVENKTVIVSFSKNDEKHFQLIKSMRWEPVARVLHSAWCRDIKAFVRLSKCPSQLRSSRTSLRRFAWVQCCKILVYEHHMYVHILQPLSWFVSTAAKERRRERRSLAETGHHYCNKHAQFHGGRNYARHEKRPTRTAGNFGHRWTQNTLKKEFANENLMLCKRQGASFFHREESSGRCLRRQERRQVHDVQIPGKHRSELVRRARCFLRRAMFGWNFSRYLFRFSGAKIVIVPKFTKVDFVSVGKRWHTWNVTWGRPSSHLLPVWPSILSDNPCLVNTQFRNLTTGIQWLTDSSFKLGSSQCDLSLFSFVLIVTACDVFGWKVKLCSSLLWVWLEQCSWLIYFQAHHLLISESRNGRVSSGRWVLNTNQLAIYTVWNTYTKLTALSRRNLCSLWTPWAGTKVLVHAPPCQTPSEWVGISHVRSHEKVWFQSVSRLKQNEGVQNWVYCCFYRDLGLGLTFMADTLRMVSPTLVLQIDSSSDGRNFPPIHSQFVLNTPSWWHNQVIFLHFQGEVVEMTCCQDPKKLEWKMRCFKSHPSCVVVSPPITSVVLYCTGSWLRGIEYCRVSTQTADIGISCRLQAPVSFPPFLMFASPLQCLVSLGTYTPEAKDFLPLCGKGFTVLGRSWWSLQPHCEGHWHVTAMFCRSDSPFKPVDHRNLTLLADLGHLYDSVDISGEEALPTLYSLRPYRGWLVLNMFCNVHAVQFLFQ